MTASPSHAFAATGFKIAVFFSGAASLAYQIAWERMFVTLFGIDFYCVAAISTAFLTGLGLGAWWFGRVVDRVAIPPLKLYAWIEIGIGATGLLSGPLITALAGPAAAIQASIDDPLLYFAVCFVAVLVVILPPTALMGGTLPVMVKHIVGRAPMDTGRTIGGFYAANTGGAVLGCVAAGFVLVGLLGLDGTVQAAAAVNLTIGLVCLALSHSEAPARPAPVAAARAVADGASGRMRLLLWLYGLSSAAALGWQLAWYRVSALGGWEAFPGLFAWVLGWYLLGAAIGSRVFRHVADRVVQSGMAMFGLLQFAAVLAAVAGLMLFRAIHVGAGDQTFNGLVGLLEWASSPSGASIDKRSIGTRITDFLWWAAKFPVLIALPMVIQGVCFPLVSTMAASEAGRSGRDIGLVYLVSIVGSVAGAFLFGFAIMPAFGLRSAILALLLTGLVAGALALGRDQGARRPAFLVGVPALAATILFLAQPANFYRWLLDRNVTTVVEGVTGAAYVVETEMNGRNVASIWLNDIGHGVISPFVDSDDYLQAATFVGLHPKPRRALLIGLGNASMLVATAQFRELERIDVVEISRELLPALRARPEFAVTHGAITDPRVGFHETDGRMFLARSQETWDLIATAPFYAWHNSAGYLYSVESYRAIAAHLSPGGVFCMINDHWFAPEAGLTQIRTFAEVFPHFVTVGPRRILCGSQTPFAVDPARHAESWALNGDWLIDPPGRDDRYGRFNLDRPAGFVAQLREDARAYPDLALVPLNTDMNPRSEFWYLQAPMFPDQLRRAARTPRPATAARAP
jgi:spermidine synthase